MAQTPAQLLAAQLANPNATPGILASAPATPTVIQPGASMSNVGPAYTPPPPPAPTYNQPTATPITISALSTPAQISAFQTANNLPVTGTMTPATSTAYVKQSPGYVATPSGSAFGSSSGSMMGSTIAGASASAANSLTALYDTTTGFLTPAGVAAGAPAVNAGDPNAPKAKSTIPTVDANGNVTLPSGQVINSQGQTIKPATATPPNTPTITASVTDSNGNVTNTYSDGTSQVTPVSPTLAPLYGQASVATTQETNNFNDQLSALNLTTQQQLQQNATNKANAMAAAEANYDSINSGSDWIGTDKAQYLNSVGAPFDQNATNIQADANIQIKSLNDTHSANLQNIQTQLQSGIQTNNANIYNAGLDTLQSLEKGDGTPLSDFDNATLVQQLTTGGTMTVPQAQLEIQTALLQAQTSQNKVLNTEQRQQQAQYISLWKNDLSTMTDPQTASSDPSIINDGLMAGIAGNPVGFDADGNPAYTDAQRQQVSQTILNSGFKQQTQAANIKFKSDSLNERYAALAQNKSLSEAGKVLSVFNSGDPSLLTPSGQVDMAQNMVNVGLFSNLQDAESYVQAGPNKLEPTTTSTSGGFTTPIYKSPTSTSKEKVLLQRVEVEAL